MEEGANAGRETLDQEGWAQSRSVRLASPRSFRRPTSPAPTQPKFMPLALGNVSPCISGVPALLVYAFRGLRKMHLLALGPTSYPIEPDQIKDRIYQWETI